MNRDRKLDLIFDVLHNVGGGTDVVRLTRIENKLDVLLNRLDKMGVRMAKELDDLTAQVTSNGAVITSAVTLIQGLKTKLDEAIASGDPAALQALSDALAASDQSLAEAVAANTPAAEEPPA